MGTNESLLNNSPILTLQSEKFNFAFGVAKARLILENIDTIREFVAKNTKKETVNA